MVSTDTKQQSGASMLRLLYCALASGGLMKGCVGKVGQRDAVPAKICFMFTCHMDDRLATNQSVQLYGSRAGGISPAQAR